jgi:hypothetical protein
MAASRSTCEVIMSRLLPGFRHIIDVGYLANGYDDANSGGTADVDSTTYGAAVKRKVRR